MPEFCKGGNTALWSVHESGVLLEVKKSGSVFHGVLVVAQWFTVEF